MLERLQERVVLAHEPSFELGAVSFHPPHRVIGNDRGSVVVEPRVMQLFVALARADGAILSRDDIMERCWNGRIVGDNALHRAVRRARQVLEKVGQGTLQIETIKGVGYRLRSADASSEPFGSRTAGVGDTAGAVISRRGALVAIGVCSAAAASGFLLYKRSTHFPSDFAVSLYTQAEAARRAEYMDSREQAIALYREALRDSPAFPAAWAGLSLTYCQMMEGALDTELGSLANLALSAAGRCLELDPGYLDGRLARAVVPSYFGKWRERLIQLHELAGEPQRSWTLNAYLGRVAADMGDRGSAVEFFGRAHEAQPAISGLAGQLAYAMWAAGKLHDLEQLLEVGSTRWRRSWFLWNVRFNYLAYSGQYGLAAEQVQSRETLPFSLHPNAVDKRLRLVRALRDRHPGDLEASKDVYLAEAIERPPHVRNAGLALAALGARDELLAVLRGYLLGEGRFATPLNIYSRRPTYFLFLPPFEQFWRDSSFVELVERVGLKEPGSFGR